MWLLVGVWLAVQSKVHQTEARHSVVTLRADMARLEHGLKHGDVPASDINNLLRIVRKMVIKSDMVWLCMIISDALQCDYVLLQVKVHTLDIAPLRSESPPQKRSGMARVLKGFRSVTCTPTRSSAVGMSHTCLCLPSRSWYSFTDPGGMEGWVDLGAK